MPSKTVPRSKGRLAAIASAYFGVSTGLVGVANSAFPALNLPTWSYPVILMILGAGFPITLLMAWGLRPKSEGKSTDAVEEEVSASSESPPESKPPERWFSLSVLIETMKVSDRRNLTLAMVGSVLCLCCGLYGVRCYANPSSTLEVSITQRYTGESKNREHQIVVPTSLDILQFDPTTLKVEAQLVWSDIVETKADLVGELKDTKLNLKGIAMTSMGSSWDVTMTCKLEPADSVITGSYELAPRLGNDFGPQHGDINLMMHGRPD